LGPARQRRQERRTISLHESGKLYFLPLLFREEQNMTTATKKEKTVKELLAGNGNTPKIKEVVIAPPNMQTARFGIRGTAQLVINAFGAKAREEMKTKQEAGSTAKKGKKREAKNFQQLYEDAKHISEEGWCGISAVAFRLAMISACRMCGFVMTRAKLSVFVEPDGYDAADRTPLVKITKGEPEYFETIVRLETGVCDIRPRPLWKPGWEAVVTVRWDGDQFTSEDVANLLARAGMQVGICEGRPDSKSSGGQGWGLFQLITGEPVGV
jgi:hypothetical protein